MPLSVLVIMLLAAFITAIVAAMGKCPLWVPVIFLCITVALYVLPGR